MAYFRMEARTDFGKLDGLEEALRNNIDVVDIIKKETQTIIKKNFQVLPRGKWAAHAPATIAKRKSLGTWYGKQNSMLREFFHLYIGSVVNPVMKTVGNSIIYSPGLTGKRKQIAKWQQYGTTSKKWTPGQPISKEKSGKGIPARPFLGLFAGDEKLIMFRVGMRIIKQSAKRKRIVVIK
jgi:hypothetical protein